MQDVCFNSAECVLQSVLEWKAADKRCVFSVGGRPRQVAQSSGFGYINTVSKGLAADGGSMKKIGRENLDHPLKRGFYSHAAAATGARKSLCSSKHFKLMETVRRAPSRVSLMVQGLNGLVLSRGRRPRRRVPACANRAAPAEDFSFSEKQFGVERLSEVSEEPNFVSKTLQRPSLHTAVRRITLQPLRRQALEGVVV